MTGLVLTLVLVLGIQKLQQVSKVERTYFEAKPTLMTALEFGEDLVRNGIKSPLSAIFPSTPIAANLTKLVMTDFSPMVRLAQTSLRTYVDATLVDQSSTPPDSTNVALMLLSILEKGESMRWGDGSSILPVSKRDAGDVPDVASRVTLDGAAGIEPINPIPPFLNTMANPESLGALGRACVLMINNARGVSWADSYTKYDTNLAGDWVEDPQPVEWDISEGLFDAMDSIKPYCQRVASMYVAPAPGATVSSEKESLGTGVIIGIVVASVVVVVVTVAAGVWLVIRKRASSPSPSPSPSSSIALN